MKSKKLIKYIDLFAGLGGIRLGFNQACEAAGYETNCVLTAEIKTAAIKALTTNFGVHTIHGDVTTIDSSEIPDFDFLLAGFPCQAFSVAGKQRGFMDTRGTLFFEVERILREKKPYGFILENVEGLVTHDRENPQDKIGRTLSTILYKLETELGYQVSWKVLDAQRFGLAQSRNRVYIVGTKNEKISLLNFKTVRNVFRDVMETGLETEKSRFTKLLFDKYKPEELYGKAIKDKRGGIDNIHSWDVELRGHVTDQEKELLNTLLKERRKKHWAYKRRGDNGADIMAVFCKFGEIRSLTPSDPQVQALVVRLKNFITEHYYTCTDEILASLGEIYVADERFKTNIDSASCEGIAELVSKAIAIYIANN